MKPCNTVSWIVFMFTWKGDGSRQSRSELIKLVIVKGNPFDFFLYSTFNLVYYLPYVLLYLKFIVMVSIHCHHRQTLALVIGS